ncbi:pre-mRNA-splicing factor 38A-like [Saccoglossus kowalevskii]|uniref:Pre-mRNA-splicing factor 38 n=1 Tax=Saccoglossus kowalevskii TaxID=10224 RepID=A0ABM0GVM8_SACKO|nr:PREDICTED: pre-mRNA-splicing factor 38A-like [Saccoglossus kowalevskii]
MANRTVKDAHSVKGTNPQYLVEKIIRSRIYECRYWKEECFALSAELLVDKAMALTFVGGIYGGNVKPTPFLCLTLKMLQIQPEKDIIVEFIRNEDFKYVRCLGALYMRLVGNALDCFKYLEPLYNDYRKIKIMNRSGKYELSHVDEFIDELLHEERLCDIILPRIQKRYVLEDTNQLEPRISALEDDLDDIEESEDEIEADEKRSPSPEIHHSYRDLDKPKRSPSPKYRRSRSPHRRKSRSLSPRRDSHRRRSRSPRRRRSRSRERRHRSPGHRHRDEDRHRDDDRHQRSRHHHSPSPEDRPRKHKKKKKERDRDRERDSRRLSDKDPDVAEANALRASLGLPPLK